MQVALFIVSLLVLLCCVTSFRIRNSKDAYYTNSMCRQIIIDVTHNFLDSDLEYIIVNRPIVDIELIIQEIVSEVYTTCDKRVILYYENNKDILHKIIKSIITKRAENQLREVLI